MAYDVLLIHPPAFPDFRKKVFFPGPLSRTVTYYTTPQFTQIPLGMLSIADYLDRNGYKVLVDNVGERMVYDPVFDLERHIRKASAEIFAIDLHWVVHARGAIELARICKKFHPNALIIIGGLTATIFHEEIIRKFNFVDIVIRGEAEDAFLELLKVYENRKKISETPNLTFRNKDKVVITPLRRTSSNLDSFEFTRLDLLEPKRSAFIPGTNSHWGLPICRGCIFNCVTCGGSAYSYRTYLGIENPIFRSPEKIVEDMQRLTEQGIQWIGLYQDIRMGGNQYWRKLLTLLRECRIDIERLSIDLLWPAEEDYIRSLSNIGGLVTLQISPESGSYTVRKAHGRNYTNEDIIKTVELCHKYEIPITVYFMVGLAKETRESFEETCDLWEKLCQLDKNAVFSGKFKDIKRRAVMRGPIVGHMILLDPGSLAFDFPERYGYRLIFRNLEDYIKGLSAVSWYQWISYETESLDKYMLADLILDSIEHATYQREKYGVYDKRFTIFELFQVKAHRVMIREVDRIMSLQEKSEIISRLRSLRDALIGTLEVVNEDTSSADMYDYRKMMQNILRETIYEHALRSL